MEIFYNFIITNLIKIMKQENNVIYIYQIK